MDGAERDDAAGADPDVAAPGRGPGAVDERTATDEEVQVVHRGTLLRAHAAGQEGRSRIRHAACGERHNRAAVSDASRSRKPEPLLDTSCAIPGRRHIY